MHIKYIMVSITRNTNWPGTFFYTKVLLDCVFPIPIERKSVQNISINNFQLNQPNSIT